MALLATCVVTVYLLAFSALPLAVAGHGGVGKGLASPAAGKAAPPPPASPAKAKTTKARKTTARGRSRSPGRALRKR